MLQTLFSPSPAKRAGRALYAEVSAAARQPVFYLEGAAPDTPTGRFELYLLHVVLVLRRLKGEGAEAKTVSQALFDTFVRSLDDGLRDLGVGDLSVGKKMRKLGEAIYGRLKSYDAALGATDPLAETTALLGRTLYAGQESAGRGLVAAYVLQATAALERQPLASLLKGEAYFPVPTSTEAAA